MPTLTVAQVTVPLTEPGSAYNDRVNQLDLSLSKTFRLQQMRMTPEINVFNAFNVSPVLRQMNVFGPSLSRPNKILEAQLFRLGVRMDF